MTRTRVCSTPGCPRLTTARDSKCQEHRTYSPTYHQADTAERRRRAEAVATWRRANGDWCPGFNRDPHETTDLTADHVVAVVNGGGSGELTVLCRSCNSRKNSRDISQQR